MPAYIEFDETSPLGTQSGPVALDKILHNFLSLREKFILGGIANWTFSRTIGGGTAKQPAEVLFEQDPVRVKGTIDWTRGRTTEIEWEYSTDSGGSYVPLLTQNFSYDAAGNLSGISGASSFHSWMTGQFMSRGNREDVIELTNGNSNNILDWDLGGVATLTVTGTSCAIEHDHLPDGVAGTMVLEITNGGLGVAATLFPVEWWPDGTRPTLQSSGVDIIVMYTHDGTIVHASLTNPNSSAP